MAEPVPSSPVAAGWKYCWRCAAPIPATASECATCRAVQPGVAVAGGGGGVIAVVIIAVVLGGVFVVGVLAAIAIPNFLRYQLRAKEAVIRNEVQTLVLAEDVHRRSAKGYRAIPALPSAGEVGSRKMAWSASDRAFAEELQWPLPEGGSYARFRVATQADAAGHQSLAICAESDLDGDGEVAATVLFRPAADASGNVLFAPDAPCDARAGGPVPFAPGVRTGEPIRVKGPNVF
jgi:type II secretory pathway pseudopilin PulG